MRLALLTATAALVLSSSGLCEAQFNPQGRTKKPHPASGGTARPASHPTAKPSGASTAKPSGEPTTPKGANEREPGDRHEGERRGSDREALIARYLGAAMAQPGAEFPIERLVELYRERDGKLDALTAELERRAAGTSGERYAALLGLAAVERLEGNPERAIESYARASAEQPKNPAAELALAHLYEQRGESASARTHFEQALARSSDPTERESILRSLRTLALDQRDFTNATRYQRELEQHSKGSFFVRAELGRELLARGENERAIDELKAVVKAAAGDNRVLAPALRDLGMAQARAGQRKEAIATLEQALAASGAAAGVRREVYQAIAEAYRAEDRLPELVARLEQKGARDPDELRLLASLYEESGHIDKALTTYKQALAREPADVATRLKVVSLLEAQGQLDQAVHEYEALIQAAPRNPDYVFRLVGALLQRGDRQRALEELRRLEARSGDDEDTLAALVDFYERVGEKERSLALLERLAAASGRDPEHLVELGARYWAAGDKTRAVATWQRIRVLTPDRVQGLLAEGDVLLDHDLVKEGLEALNEAVKLEPGQTRAQKAYALGLERAAGAQSSPDARRIYLDEALAIWEKLLKGERTGADLAREARQHVVTLWGLRGQSAQRMTGLAKRFAATPPDLDAGRLLAEAELRARSFAAAERTLTRISELAPSDAEALKRLETVFVQERKLADAIGVLGKLVTLEPKHAREYYQRMAEYSAELYKDDDAVRYAARAVELAPDDADGHAKLGRMYRRRQENERAIGELRQAIQKNDRAFAVHLELAELLLDKGQLDEADLLLRRVIRASPDEDLVSRAARLSVQLNLGRGTLESLEREILPLALANPERPLFRRLLVEIYGAIAYPLVHRVRTGTPAEAEEARRALAKLGDRAVKPLLDALADDRASQQQVAITLLSHVASKSAGPSLVAYAKGNAETSLRTRAMIAAGTLRDPSLLPKLEAVLFADGRASADDSDPVAVAAAWAVARMGSPKARPLLVRLASGEAPNLRALGALGLGILHDASAVPELARVVGSADAGNLARAAAARALGMLGARNEIEAISALARTTSPELRGSALLALAELKAPDAANALADALVDPDPELRRVAAAAAAAWTSGVFRAPSDPLPAPDERVEVRELLDTWRPGPYSVSERLAALERLAPALSRASESAAQSSPERARAVVDALGLAPGGTPVPALCSDFSGDELGRARHVVDGIGTNLVPALAALTRHPYAPIRAGALAFLGSRQEPLARDAVVNALGDADPAVRRAALAVARTSDAAVASAVADRLTREEDWALRVAAAEALARAPGVASGVSELTRAATSDPYALVREGAVRALFVVDPKAARPVLERIEKTDAEPRVRNAAWQLLGGS
jgi:tetratricopeptide (TPR) repeat protein/HEAT repeat protein